LPRNRAFEIRQGNAVGQTIGRRRAGGIGGMSLLAIFLKLGDASM
jgi:hypothetical protein